jgi:hypothetical protein
MPLTNDDRARGRAKHRVGRVQQACRRAFIAAHGRDLTTSQLIGFISSSIGDWGCGRALKAPLGIIPTPLA